MAPQIGAPEIESSEETDISITLAMTEQGLAVLTAANPHLDANADLVADIYRAMHSVRPDTEMQSQVKMFGWETIHNMREAIEYMKSCEARAVDHLKALLQ